LSSLEWVLIAIVCGALEIAMVGLWFLWLAFSALLVAIGTSLHWLNSLDSQLLVFAFFSLLFIIFTRPLVMKTIKTEDTFSNVQALIGQHGLTVSPISRLNYGQVKVNGEIWTAFSEEEIDTGIRIEVTGIDGVKLKVKRAD